jgi:hypothetical protein
MKRPGRKLDDALQICNKTKSAPVSIISGATGTGRNVPSVSSHNWQMEGLVKINGFRRSGVIFPLVSIIVLAQSAYAEEATRGPAKGPPGRPAVQAAHPGPGRPGPMPGRGPQGAHFARGPLPSHNFGGHAYHGHLAWEGGRWHHEMRNGRDGYWWDVGGAWYFYPQPMDGPPTYVSDVEVADDAYAPDGPPVAAGPPGYPPPPVAYAPPPPPPPPDPAAGAVGGAVVGGLLGGLLTGRPGGAVAGAIVGGTTGAIVGAQAAARPGYYLAQGGCYYRYPSGQYVAVDPRACN